jgi:flagellar biogenesis protein FliO
MEILSRLGVGPNRSIMVVRVGPRFLVIGSTETGISLLSELSEEEARDFDVSQVTDKQA